MLNRLGSPILGQQGLFFVATGSGEILIAFLVFINQRCLPSNIQPFVGIHTASLFYNRII